ncbi:MAG: hypothetical protein HDR09_10020 [Lachnospiraceae bacterium]|nr:hypothetical protein [Lachnospiraceae bacterium]
MIRLPISDYVANYYKKQGIEFTLRQQAHFCWYYNDLLKDQLNSLREILEISEDEKLNTEIKERIAYEEKAYECFMTEQEGCFYIVRPDDKDEYEEEYFASAGKAISYGIHHCNKYFEVVKRWLFDKNPNGQSEETGDDDSENANEILSQYCFTSKGDIKSGWSNEYKAPFDQEDYNRFEYMFLYIESPFGLGDIVMGPDFERPGVVSVDHDCFMKHYDRMKDREYIQFDTGDNCIRVDKIGPDGDLTYDHATPFDLWKVDSWEDKECWKLLQSMSTAVKNGSDLLEFDFLRQQYGERNEEHKDS